MLRTLRVLLAVALVLPAPGWAAGNIQASGSIPTMGAIVPGAVVPAIPALPQTSIPSLSGSLSTPQIQTITGAPQASAAQASNGLPAASAITSVPGAKDGVIPAAPQAALPAASHLNNFTNGSQQPGGEKNPGASALQRLQADVPFEAPRDGDIDGAKSFSDKAFEFKLGAQSAGDGEAVTPDAAGTGATRGPAKTGGKADDGGGDNYPSRSIRFRGKLFRTVLFRPNVPVEPEIIRAIDTAKKSIHIALYEFKLPGVLEALRQARDRGVAIHIVLDYSNVFPTAEAGSTYQPRRSREIWGLLREGFDVKVLRGLSDYGINHNKFAVIDYGEDQTMAIFGSYNWSWSAEEAHYENANFTTEDRRIEALKTYWDWLNSMAVPEPQARDHAWPTTVPAPPVTIAEDVKFNGIKLPSVVLSPSQVDGKSLEDRLVQAIDASQKSVDVIAFAIRSTKIAEALARAKDRKLKVRVIMDEGQADSGPFGDYARWLAAKGIELRTLAGPDPNSDFPMAQKTHAKVGIFDGKLVEAGSANYTKYASAANFENAHFLDDARDVAGYTWIYERMFKRAKKFDAPATVPTLPTDAELTAEVQRAPKPAPAPGPHPGPTDPALKPRPIPFNGHTFPSYAFRPDTPIKPMVVEAIDAAKTSVRMAVYEFNLPEILDALRRAKKRGLTVELVIDRSHVYTTGKDHTGNSRKPSAEIQALINEGFDILTLKGSKSGIMHNKYMILDAEDGGLLQFGSYNYAKTAEENHYENVKFSDDKHDIADYLAYFQYKRGLASAIDHDKLDEVLSRGLAEDTEEATPERQAGDERDSKFPEPPVSTAPMIDYNGEKFHRHYFSPQGGIMDAWIRAIHAAEKSVDIAMFGFYAREVADVLVARIEDAKKNGTEFKVRMVLDAGQSSLAKFDGIPVAQWFAERGVDVRMKAGPNEHGDPMFEKQHNKLMVIDDKLLLTGSFNLSPTAENNSFENENVVDDATDVRAYVEYYMRIFNLGWPPRGSAPVTPAGTSTFHGA